MKGNKALNDFLRTVAPNWAREDENSAKNRHQGQNKAKQVSITVEFQIKKSIPQNQGVNHLKY